MKTRITRKQERVLYTVIDLMKELHSLQEHDNIQVIWCTHALLIEQLFTTTFPNADPTDLYLYLYNILDDTEW